MKADHKSDQITLRVCYDQVLRHSWKEEMGKFEKTETRHQETSWVILQNLHHDLQPFWQFFYMSKYDVTKWRMVICVQVLLLEAVSENFQTSGPWGLYNGRRQMAFTVDSEERHLSSQSPSHQPLTASSYCLKHWTYFLHLIGKFLKKKVFHFNLSRTVLGILFTCFFLYFTSKDIKFLKESVTLSCPYTLACPSERQYSKLCLLQRESC